MTFYNIKHITRYRYASSVIDCANQIMLYPIQDTLQVLKKHELHISHKPDVEEFVDYFGNRIGTFSVIGPITELTIESDIEIEILPLVLPETNFSIQEQWEKLSESREQFPYMDFMMLENFEYENEVAAVIKNLVDLSLSPFDTSQLLSKYVYDNFEYRKGVTTVETGAGEIWKLKAGVCQDFAHILLVMLRMVGIPARYVSGYICPKDSELRGEGATHAWVEVCIPFYGWIGIDPTNNCIANDRHVRLAIGRNFSDCTPVKGTYKGSSEHTLEVSVSIENGQLKKEAEEKKMTPVFTYKTKNLAPQTNSYRRYLEMQQQQQQ
ncbi:MAG TPA: transglutaminase family protein [Chitinophagaceae bacterium]|nr:transglutaminase family protein [Chitinophagaceae bacterium]